MIIWIQQIFFHWLQLRATAQTRYREQSQFASAVRKLGIDFRSSGTLLARAKLNRSHIEESSSPVPKILPSILWTLEFCLLLAPTIPSKCSLRSDIAWKEELLQPIRIFIHDCPADMPLGRIWRERVLALTSTEQEALVPGVNKSSNSVTSWILLLLADENPGYFYIQCEIVTTEGKKRKSYPKHEVFPDSQLIDILKYDQHAIHEFPTIWVSHKDIPTFTE